MDLLYKIRSAAADDAEAIRAIRNDVIEHSTAMWTTELLTPQDGKTWLEENLARRSAYVAEASGDVVGFANWAPWRPKDGYRHTVEDSVYLVAGHQGRGIGAELLRTLIAGASQSGAHVMMACIEATNSPSVALHARHGFELVGTAREVGTKFGRWLDLTMMRLPLGYLASICDGLRTTGPGFHGREAPARSRTMATPACRSIGGPLAPQHERRPCPPREGGPMAEKKALVVYAAAYATTKAALAPTPSAPATGRSSPSTIPTTTRGWSRRSRHGSPAESDTAFPSTAGTWHTLSRVRLDKITIVVDDYDQAIAFYTGALGFDLVEDSPSLTDDGRPKRWVVVRPPGGDTGILLAQADGERQAAAVGNQVAGRVGFFLEVDDFEAAYRRMKAAGVEFATAPRTEPYGQVAVFIDIAGNRWDLLGPAPLADLIPAKHYITWRKP